MMMSVQATVSAEVYLANGETLLQGQDTGHAKFFVIPRKISMSSRYQKRRTKYETKVNSKTKLGAM